MNCLECYQVHVDLFECVLVEEGEKLQDREIGVELHSLEVRVDKPVEEVAALGNKPGAGWTTVCNTHLYTHEVITTHLSSKC